MGGRLTIKIMGKDFSVDSMGRMSSDIHINPWIAVPVLDYILICYWKPDEGLPSTLNLFFDATADKNLPVESIYRIGAGLSVMFEKLALRHGHPGTA